ncbi:nucleoside deaminase [Methylobacterium sp. J-092]|uniref:nucleoside deaminase n=1 Tax=Methylobacterium sp. J-092 TaxID=2836667 RepID=UPI001FBBB5EB|nr:nucleoside deaminase [Methylobacterium sp. J-092]MCJ2010081.1 nucleoside deaminase [Methylobacterium sp. J-092]
MSDHARYLSEAVQLAANNVCDGGTPYGAVLVRGDEVLARVANNVHTTNDPTGHAEMVALREASRRLNSRDLSGSVMYASGQPCPMCHAAMRLSGIREGYFANAAATAGEFGLLGAEIYAELCRPLDAQPMRLKHLDVPDATAPYAAWKARKDEA